MQLLIEALFKFNIVEAKTCTDIINIVCCSKNETCCLGGCMNCKENNLYKDSKTNAPVFYRKWMQGKESYVDKRSKEKKLVPK